MRSSTWLLLVLLATCCSEPPEMDVRQDPKAISPAEDSTISEPPLSPEAKSWYPPNWPTDTHIASVGGERLEQITNEVATHYGMQAARAASAGPAGGFVYVLGTIEGQPSCWHDGQLYDRETFLAKYSDTMHSK